MKRGQEQAYEVLRQRLIGGHYTPGTHLREEPLAREFGLSRSPVRAALQRLVKDGLATADAGQGIHVSAWSDHDIEEIFRLRMQLGPLAAQFACEEGASRWSPVWLSSMRRWRLPSSVMTTARSKRSRRLIAASTRRCLNSPRHHACAKSSLA